MRKARGGSIINIASVLGINGAPNRHCVFCLRGRGYATHQDMAIDHGHENIRRNAICPSFVETDLTAAVMSKAPDPDAVPREPIGVHLIGRLDRPEAIAGLAVSLASDASWRGAGGGRL